MMTTADSKAIARRLVTEVWQHGNLALLEELMRPSSGFAAFGEHRMSREEMRAAVQLYRTAFPDLQVHIEQLIAEDETVVMRWRSEGTHQGTLPGIAATDVVGAYPQRSAVHLLQPLRHLPPSGRRMRFAGVMILRIAAGQVSECWSLIDEAELLRQLGVLPVLQPTGGASEPR